MNKEQEFHNKREAFFIEFNGAITFINKGMSHEEYFKMVHHPEYLENERIRGYLLEDHVMLYVGKNFDIPMYINMEGIFKLLNNNKIKGHNIKWIGLGCIKGEIGEEWEPQIKILPRNDSLQEEKNNRIQKTESIKSIGVNRLVNKITEGINKSLTEYFATAKTTEELAIEIYKKAKNGISFSDLAKEYNVSEYTIEYLCISAGDILKNE